ncbi:hypothetical protein GYMLUDRAFT_227867 [Collybiopsis luxurians FD-317 M1]|uniref:Uncharacterized protein n=1 Tax=Collybiopsis luxurians FD-317 M1 TaxID=944289 RepID=A0A0D0C7Z9_9AGAR|nr:hypothetical protein GYMLUDRAFT_227867 [Collybiopsis luxurians FD-317 M1]
MLNSITTSLLLASAVFAQSSTVSYPEDVIATGTMGTTNPPEPTTGTAINQTSDARLLSINAIDDWCIFAPPELQDIADSETYEVAWCTQSRNDARVIPDGTITGVSLLKTDMYVQIMGYGNLTQLNIPAGDWGGELDPHGAYGSGNPIGGNVTTNITADGQTINVAEWMLYVSYEMFCFRACTWSNETYGAAAIVLLTGFSPTDELDEMGCQFVMPGNYDFNGTFETCEADVAYPPGWYVEGVSGDTTSFSSFAQYWTGVVDGVTYTAGDTVTPSTVQSTPSSSNCQTVPTISNGIALASLGVSGSDSGSASATGSAATAGATGSSGSSSGSSGSSSASSGSSNGAVVARPGIQAGLSEGITLVSMLAAVAAIGIFH